MATAQSKTKENVNFMLNGFRKKKEEEQNKTSDISQEKIIEKSTDSEPEKKITEQVSEPNQNPEPKKGHKGAKRIYGEKPKVLTIRISIETSNKLQKICNEEEISVNSFINKAVKLQIKKWEALNEEE